MKFLKQYLLLFILFSLVLVGCSSQPTINSKDKDEIISEVLSLKNKISYLEKDLEEIKTKEEKANKEIIAALTNNDVQLSEEDTTLLETYNTFLSEPLFDDTDENKDELTNMVDKYSMDAVNEIINNVSEQLTNINSLNSNQKEEFKTNVTTVYGTLLSQNFKTSKIDLELAIKDFQNGLIDSDKLDEKAFAYQKAKKEFKTFLETKISPEQQ